MTCYILIPQETWVRQLTLSAIRLPCIKLAKSIGSRLTLTPDLYRALIYEAHFMGRVPLGYYSWGCELDCWKCATYHLASQALSIVVGQDGLGGGGAGFVLGSDWGYWQPSLNLGLEHVGQTGNSRKTKLEVQNVLIEYILLFCSHLKAQCIIYPHVSH